MTLARRHAGSKIADSRVPMKTADRQFTTLSGVPIDPVYEPKDLAGVETARDIGAPGDFPYTRGIHRDMYRGKLWTMRQFSGFATPEETNRRYRYLLSQGQTGLSVAFDLPTLMGYDADHAMSEGEVGKCGASISSLEDMEILFRGIPLGDVTVSMTINSPASVLWAMYLAVGEQQGVSWSKLSGTLQNDILKEYIAQKEFIFPPKPSMRLVTDTIEFGAKHTPKFNPISISGYHIREAGSTAVQELAFTLRDGMEYVDWALERGLDIDEFAPRLSFFFNAHSDFFEEIAKYRAARKIWAYAMRDRYGAKSERSMKLRFHAQTAGCSLTWQQPYNNVVRTALQAMAAVLGGAQSLHTNSKDEALALPTENSALLALRTQQVIANESDVTDTIDPLGGSYYIETLTSEIEKKALEYLGKIDDLGGAVAAIERGYMQREIQNAAFIYQREIETKRRIIVGVNEFTTGDAPPGDILKVNPAIEQKQRTRVEQIRAERNQEVASKAIARVEQVARDGANLMPPIIDAVRAYATLGEIADAMRRVFGEYKPLNEV